MRPRTHKEKITHHADKVKTAAQKAKDHHHRIAADAQRAHRAQAQEQPQS